MTITFDETDRQRLLSLVHQTLKTQLQGDDLPLDSVPDDDPLSGAYGAFVSLYVAGQLRGCIGHMVSDDPLWNTIQRLAVLAATSDTRFDPIRDTELSQLTVEISVLSPLRVVPPESVRVGEHGVLLSLGGRRGVLLPQVATKYGWDRETFLSHSALKAGLSEADWRDPRAIIEVFSAEVFGDDSADL